MPSAAPQAAITQVGTSEQPEEVVIGLWGSGPTVERTRLRMEECLLRSFPLSRAQPRFIFDDALAGLQAPDKLASNKPWPMVTGGYFGTESILRAFLEAGLKSPGATAFITLSDEARDQCIDWAHNLLAPVLADGFDYVCPFYRRRKYEGLLNTGIIYPLVRALFGKRLRQPLGGEIALSRRAAERLLLDEDWESEPLQAGSDLWLMGKILSEEHRICQSSLGVMNRSPGGDHQADDLSATLAKILGLLFREMERHAVTWQRIRGSADLPIFGENTLFDSEPAQANVTRMTSVFRLGHHDLQPIWRLVLSPATLFSLQKVAQMSDADFTIDDALWARIVYDFSVAFHTKVMDRGQLLRSLTPLYLGWAVSFINATRELDSTATEQRVEKMCLVFEQHKPYLISRWRWPDSFDP